MPISYHNSRSTLKMLQLANAEAGDAVDLAQDLVQGVVQAEKVVFTAPV